MLVLQEVFPTGTLWVLAMLDTAFKGEPFTTSAVNLARQNCKPERLFVDCTAAIAGGRYHCEPKHENVEVALASVERCLRQGDGVILCAVCSAKWTDGVAVVDVVMAMFAFEVW